MPIGIRQDPLFTLINIPKIPAYNDQNSFITNEGRERGKGGNNEEGEKLIRVREGKQ
jgi:hypothetical protein